ncbi:MAG: hypothetical protein DMF61_02600 [Blastocatellia bacterium AA13]|nr:MAG: hypothetical protein DMF61_02600 [Blastocatellia bacterium AA13]
MTALKRLAAALAVTTILLTCTVHAAIDDLDNVIFEGTVSDPTGAAIKDALVKAIHSSTQITKSAVTNADGRYRIVVPNSGDYSIAVEAAGFVRHERAGLATVAGRTIAINFALAPAGVSEQVSVTASANPLIDTNRTVVGDTVTQQEIQSLPLIDRDPLRLVFLLGGVTEGPLATSDLAEEGGGTFLRSAPIEAGSFSLTGAPATSNNITIDGLDNNDDRAARERISLSPESLEEIQIITNQYAAEYGRASGGRINLRTRGGTNQFRGQAYFYFGDEALNANTFFRNARGLGRIPQQQLREGATIGGPLITDRIFFFGSFERLNVSDSAEIDALVPVAQNPRFLLPAPNQPVASGSETGRFLEDISTPEVRNIGNARVDLKVSDRHTAFARFDIARGSNKRGFPGGSRLAETILSDGRDSDSISGTSNFTISGSLINQARFQYSRLLPRTSADFDSVGVIINDPARIVAGLFTGSSGSPAFAREERRLQFQDSLMWLRGSHLIKAGGDVQLIRSSFTDLFAAGGEFTFDSIADFLAGRPSRFLQRFDTQSKISNRVVGLFAQDEWKLKPNLTLSFGGRWDNESALEDRDNLSPRIALAWDPFGGRLFRSFKHLSQPGKTVVRAGFGLFYNRALLRTLDDFSLGRSTKTVDSDISSQVLASVNFPAPITDRSLVDRFGVSESQFLRRVNKDLQIPYTSQTGLGIERQISRNIVVTGDYIFTRGVHLWRETNINAPVLPSGFNSFTAFLLSRDFDNRRGAGGSRPISSANADIVRFNASEATSTTAGAITSENGIRILTLGLNAPRSSNITAALAAIRPLRPDPSLVEVEQLESTGNSFYHAGIFAVRYSRSRVHLRAVYTYSKLIDEGTTNTASPQDLLDRRAERGLSLQDQRHRFTFSGLFQLPYLKLDLSPIISFGSSKPFNLSAGFDRNLNDIENDRPLVVTDIGRPVWRRPGSPAAADVRSALAFAPIGSSGDLQRDFGIGPGTRTIDLRASRVFAINEKLKLTTAVDAFNVFNNTVFNFGAEFIEESDQDFLKPRRTQRPRTIHLSLKLQF